MPYSISSPVEFSIMRALNFYKGKNYENALFEFGQARAQQTTLIKQGALNNKAWEVEYVLRKIADIYKAQGRYKEALETYHDLVNTFPPKFKDWRIVIEKIINCGEKLKTPKALYDAYKEYLYFLQVNYPEDEYYQDLYNKGIIGVFNKLFDVFINNGQLYLAAFYNELALKHYQRYYQNNYQKACFYFKSGYLYLQLKEFELAHEFLKNSISALWGFEHKNDNFYNLIARIYKGFGDIYLEFGDVDSAKSFFVMAFHSLSRVSSDSSKYNSEIFNGLAKKCQVDGDYKNALIYISKAIRYNISSPHLFDSNDINNLMLQSELFYAIKDHNKAADLVYKAYLITHNFKPGCAEKYQLIRQLKQEAPDMLQLNTPRELMNINWALDRKMLDIKEKIQEPILNNIFHFTCKDRWENINYKYSTDIGAECFTREGYLSSWLEDLDYVDAAESKEIALMLIFETINLATMRNNFQNKACLDGFAYQFPEIVEKAKNTHPEFFVDLKIVMHLYFDYNVFNSLSLKADKLKVPKAQKQDNSKLEPTKNDKQDNNDNKVGAPDYDNKQKVINSSEINIGLTKEALTPECFRSNQNFEDSGVPQALDNLGITSEHSNLGEILEESN